MTHDEALAAMREIQLLSDTEHAHLLADQLLCKYLRTLGYDELVDAFEGLEKWYA